MQVQQLLTGGPFRVLITLELTMAAAISNMSVGSFRLPIKSEKNDFSGTALNLLM
jgi:hypothetical protein